MKEILNANGKMTSLLIAEITGKPHNDILKSIRKMEPSWIKLGQGNFSQSFYINEQNRQMPMYELTKTECLYIATKFNDEARAKLVLRWEQLEMERANMSNLDLLELGIKQLREQERRLNNVENQVSELKAKTTTRPDYFTIAGYGALIGIPVSLKIASQLGRAAAKICVDRSLPMDETPDPRFGKVRMYPRPVLEEVFNMAIA